MNYDKSIRTELFNKYILPEKDFIYRVCIKYSRSKEECNEYFSQVMIHIFNGIKSYNTQLNVRPWLYIIIGRYIRRSHLEFTKLQRTEFVNIEELDISSIDNDTVSSNCMGIDNYHEYYSEDILQALNMINPVSRNVILLQQAGYKYKEIADRLYNAKLIRNRSIESIKYHLRIGKN